MGHKLYGDELVPNLTELRLYQKIDRSYKQTNHNTEIQAAIGNPMRCYGRTEEIS